MAALSLHELQVTADGISEFARSIGFTYAMFGLRIARDSEKPVQIIVSAYPQAWLQRYDEHEHMRIDPVLPKAQESLLPFAWDEIERSDPAVASFFTDAARYGLGHGFSCPVHGPHRDFALLCLARSSPLPKGNERQELFDRAQLWALKFFAAMFAMVQKSVQVQTLTDRQREVLTLVGEGHTVKQIAELTSAHPRSIEDLLRRACQVLGVETREQAIVRALIGGQIIPSQYPTLLQQSTVFKVLPYDGSSYVGL